MRADVAVPARFAAENHRFVVQLTAAGLTTDEETTGEGFRDFDASP